MWGEGSLWCRTRSFYARPLRLLRQVPLPGYRYQTAVSLRRGKCSHSVPVSAVGRQAETQVERGLRQGQEPQAVLAKERVPVPPGLSFCSGAGDARAGGSVGSWAAGSSCLGSSSAWQHPSACTTLPGWAGASRG